MDIGSAAGLVIVLIGIFLGMIMKGADPVSMFTNVAALLIVIVSSFGAVVLSNPLPVTTSALKALVKIFLPGPPPDVPGTIDTLTGYADKARREGLLALEADLDGVEDRFLRSGMRLAVDGHEPAVVKQIMLADIKGMKDRHKAVAAWFTGVGVFAPSFGIIGAVVGLIAVMGKLDDPAEMGHGIAAAFVATFWGVFLANGMFLPWANKLKALSATEVAHRLLILEGVLAIQQG
jgi:chemotaxis protein MotA